MKAFDLEAKFWWNYVTEDIRELLKESAVLLDKVSSWQEKFHDYSFVVFPAAKAYEGFLKKLFLDLGFISREDYFGKRFRVGKSLNPALEKKYRAESVYAELVNFCGGRELPDKLWQAWKEGRNLLFHWFPREKNAISLDEAQSRVEFILIAMDEAYLGCKLERSKK